MPLRPSCLQLKTGLQDSYKAIGKTQDNPGMLKRWIITVVYYDNKAVK